MRGRPKQRRRQGIHPSSNDDKASVKEERQWQGIRYKEPKQHGGKASARDHAAKYWQEWSDISGKVSAQAATMAKHPPKRSCEEPYDSGNTIHLSWIDQIEEGAEAHVGILQLESTPAGEAGRW
jgi:hypothetical protein